MVKIQYVQYGVNLSPDQAKKIVKAHEIGTVHKIGTVHEIGTGVVHMWSVYKIDKKCFMRTRQFRR